MKSPLSRRIKQPLSPISAKVGEYLPASSIPSPALPATPKRGLLRRLFSPLILAITTVATVFLLLTIGRQWYDSLLVRMDLKQKVHSDQSVARSGIRSQVSPTITLVYKNQSGKIERVIANAQQYSEFVQQQIAKMEFAKTQLLTPMQAQLQHSMTTIFDELRPRIDRFADWYFAYPTTYKILWEATTSASNHLLKVEAVSLSDAVAYDVEKYLHQHYEDLVLRPELTDPKLQQLFRQMLQLAHDQYLMLISQLQADFQVFVAQQTTHLKAPLAKTIELELDWDSQLNKINFAEYEKTVAGGVIGSTLVAGGAVMGKTLAGVGGKTVAGVVSEGMAAKAIASAASKGVMTKLASPFVSKAVLVGTGGAIGGFGGPLGAALGASAGLGIDYALNEGIELTQRNTFIADVNSALTTTQTEWNHTLWQAIQTTINIWLEDTIQLLPRYYPTE